MSNQNNRGGDDDDDASSNTPAEPERKSVRAEKPENRDDNGSREAGHDWDN